MWRLALALIIVLLVFGASIYIASVISPNQTGAPGGSGTSSTVSSVPASISNGISAVAVESSTSASTSTATQGGGQDQSGGGELCNAKRYNECSVGEKFYCDASGGECVPQNNTLCNGEWYVPCSDDLQFSCPPSGKAECLAPESDTTVTGTPVTPINIEEKGIVALLCNYNLINPEGAGGDGAGDQVDAVQLKGSGVVVSPDGYIITAKHIVDPQWTNWAYSASLTDSERALNDNLKLDYCEVGMPQDENLPTAEEIKSVNPSQALQGGMQYDAKLFFEPSQGVLSDYEYRTLDFAVLKITTTTAECSTWSSNDCNEYGHFPYDPALYSAVPQPGNELIDFGYPVEASPNYDSQFYLKGAAGPLKNYYAGDSYFKDGFLEMDWEANDLIPGRSGSPVFWNGYVVGIEVAGGNGQPLDEAVGMPAIHKVLISSGLTQVLSAK